MCTPKSTNLTGFNNRDQPVTPHDPPRLEARLPEPLAWMEPTPASEHAWKLETAVMVDEASIGTCREESTTLHTTSVFQRPNRNAMNRIWL